MSKPIRVLFDASPLVNGQLSGIGYLTKGAIESLAKNYPDDVMLIGHYFNFLGKKAKNNLVKAPNIRYVESKFLPGKCLSLLRRFGLQIPFDLLIRTRGDVAFFPNFVSLPLLQKIPSIITIADLGFVDCPEYVQYKNRHFLQKFVPQSVKKASLIFAISEATKKAIVKNYATDGKRIIITHIPVAPMPHGQPKPDIVSGRYILFVSTLEPRKNFMTLVRAYCDLPKSLKDNLSLVLAGGEGWDVEDDITEIQRLIAEGEKIIITGYVDELTRAGLYEHADLFIMPSYYEGFGMPLLEAMSYDVPVLASNIPVFLEVAGDAAIYANPNDVGEFSEKIKTILSSKETQAKSVKAGRNQIQKYTWDKMARTMYEAISSLVDKEK